MSDVTIYHNPRCSKSRETLALLRAQGIEPEVVEYLKSPPDRAALKAVLDKLGLRPRDLIRRKEAPFTDLGLKVRLEDDDALLDAMIEHPILIERPIVIKGGQARLGRPPEQVLDIL